MADSILAASLPLPTREGLPRDVAEEANENVGLNTLGLLLVPDWSDPEIALVEPESRFRLDQLHMGSPEFAGVHSVTFDRRI